MYNSLVDCRYKLSEIFDVSVCRRTKSVRFFLKLAQIFNDTGAAFGFSCGANVSAMQNKPVVNVDFKFFWYVAQQLLFDFDNVFARGKFGAIGQAEYVGVDGNGRPAKVSGR